jgi:NADH-quinone oxidoreductase subunit A
MYFHFANVLVFTVIAIAFLAGMLALGSLLRPNNPEPLKLTTYECGEPPTGNAWVNFNIRFYLVALIFVIFDVEVAFIYPVAAVFKEWVNKGQSLFALTEIGLFLAILFAGLVYVWAKGDLEWLKKVPADAEDTRHDRLRDAA